MISNTFLGCHAALFNDWDCGYPVFGQINQKLAVMVDAPATRPLTKHERLLAQWMLEHGNAEASRFLPQLARAEATAWRCECGCASFNFKVAGEPEAPAGVNILGDFVAGEGEEMFGVFIFQSGGILSGLEVYSLAASAPPVLPAPEQLRPFKAAAAAPHGVQESGGRNDG
ncbi:hypothetical protein [Paracidovorax sp. MALMAid1276]|uniref:hypothetical protein n=1 Tax=Paracidovorax sp. MALMAid1276 TaxID=3411631 RepID=UPI003B9A8BEE